MNRLLKFAFATLAPLMLIVGCGGGGGNLPTATPTSIPSPTPVGTLPPVTSTETTVASSSDGFNISLPNYATVSFGKNTLPSGKVVTLRAEQSADMQALYAVYKAVDGADKRSPFEVVISSPSFPFNSDINVAIKIPAYLSGVPQSSLLALVANQEVTSYEDFEELIPITVSSVKDGIISLNLKRWAFSVKDKTYVARILVIANVATRKSAVDPPSGMRVVRAESSCPTSDIQFPLRTPYRITSPFGLRVHPITGVEKYHAGIDIASSRSGDKPSVYAAATGTVLFAGTAGGYGNLVSVEHTATDGTKFYTKYGHLDPIAVKKGDPINIGQQVGIMGTTGSSTAVHLHFELKDDNGQINPTPCLKINLNGFVGLWSGTGVSNQSVEERITLQITESEDTSQFNAVMYTQASDGSYSNVELSGPATPASNGRTTLLLTKVIEATYSVCDLTLNLQLSADGKTLTTVVPAGDCVGGTSTLQKIEGTSDANFKTNMLRHGKGNGGVVNQSGCSTAKAK